MENNLPKWLQDWVDKTSYKQYENSFNEKSDEWTIIDGVGKFKGLKILTDETSENEIIITLKFDERIK